MSNMGRLRRLLPFVVALVAAVALWQMAGQFEYRVRSGHPGPDVWPRIVLLVMAVAALWGLVGALVESGEEKRLGGLIGVASRAVGKEEAADRELKEEAGEDHPERLLPAALAILAIVLYVALIGVIGFTLATFALMLAIMLIGGYRHLSLAIVIAAVGTLGFFVLFQRVAYISLPQGSGPFRELTLALMALVGVR
jgi:8-oxo-dGTP pyrophosphatase MutT (NUDIX family)